MVLSLRALSFRQISMRQEITRIKTAATVHYLTESFLLFFLINVQLNASLTIWNTLLDQEIPQT